jgi:hypothetical protein
MPRSPMPREVGVTLQAHLWQHQDVDADRTCLIDEIEETVQICCLVMVHDPHVRGRKGYICQPIAPQNKQPKGHIM